ncbi:hypothetical protein BW12_07090 [Bifidobacterium sp. UTCIF-3]|uniref:tape measure protein n=1 Tax=unclassified Bifidobacterium TaxID=2608897 RepID=UPI00112BB759|nr:MULTISPECIES: tape measure protein [unclassified Bifidobacterium]TPF78348.1 hypothetical protein BW09_04655 [Bifidobacterium sp. UTCIF-1]TPF81231.1 hypothetical protein BW08_00925 [Bifidobacterium sp. UTCIF-24]TPF82012.1 hypothetical protein BW12_07090 [Bifidobacterium sp. UTCIF-3]TPF85140.1 hypothetical protein BW07_00260 [Bifidobacterium sp. UTCIF-36]
MAKELGTGYIIISPSTKGLGKAIEGSIGDATTSGVKTAGSTILSRVGGAFKTVGNIGVTAVGAVTGAIVGLAAKGGFDRALNIERAQTKLKALGHDTKSVDGIMSDALASVKGTAYGLGDAASVAASLVASGIRQGDELAGVLSTVGDVAQVSGRSFTDMGLIFQQVAAKGKLQGDEMLQLMQSGIPVLQYLADHFGITAAEAQDMVSDGKVSFADFEAAMREHLGGAAQSAGESFDGAMGNIRAALSRLGETIATPVINGLTSMANQAIPIIDDFTAQAKPALEGVGKALGDGLSNAIPTALSLLEQLKSALQWYVDNSAAVNAALITVAGGFAAIKAYTALASGLGALAGAMDLVKASADGLSAAIIIGPELGGTVARLGEYARNLTLVANAQNAARSMSGMLSSLKGAATALGGALSGTVGVWGLVAAGVAALAAGLAYFFTQTETGKAAWQSFMDFLQPLWESVQAAWQQALPVLQGLVDSLGQAFTGMLDAAAPVLQSLGEWFMKALEPIKANLPALMDAFGQLGTALGDAFTQVMPVVQDSISQIMDAFNQLAPVFGQLVESIGPLVTTLVDALAPIIPVIVGALAMLMPVISQIVTMIASMLMPVISQVVTMIAAFLPVIIQIVTTLVGMLVPVITAIVQLVTAMIPVITQVITTIISVLTPVITAIIGAIQGVLTVLTGVITFLTGVFSGNWQQAWDGIKQVFSGVWQAVKSVFTGIWEAIKAAIRGGLNIIKSLWDAAWNGIKTVFSTIWDGIKNAARNGVDGVLGTISGIKDKITGFFSGAGSWLASAGRSIVQGLIDGITGMIGAAGDAISGVMDKISSFLPHSPAEEGPFSGRGWTPYSGRALVSGLAQGVSRGMPEAMSAIDKVMTAMSDRIDGASFKTSVVPSAFAAWTADALRTMTALDLAGMRSGVWQPVPASRTITYNISIDARRVQSDARISSLIEELVDAAGVTVRSRA